jgi:16S rRNA C967 or C1407 C5-methylase (RsmB/RsmF family)
MQLPEEFIQTTRRLMGDERFERYLQAFDEEPPVSIRLNPWRLASDSWQVAVDHDRVPWCREGYYLRQRPVFTFDPLFHAGCYYVQEAASMFLDEVIRQTSPNPSEGGEKGTSPCPFEGGEPKSSPLGRLGGVLDLCAAPGGKSTLLRSALPEDCMLYSNEPIRNRASILLENVEKWGYPHHVVTNNYPKDYRKAKMLFDLILCDVPCSGEGMFRKDPATIREWSPQQVEKCWPLQREIVDDAWTCLNPGGLLIYSTCTFNTKENEENIRYFLQQYDDMEVVPIETQADWHITGSLLDGFHEPVYRFIPGISRGEGLFLCVLKKKGEREEAVQNHSRKGADLSLLTPHSTLLTPPSSLLPPPSTLLNYTEAMAYLRGEVLHLPEDTPRGLVTVGFEGFPLGQVKNIGSRANNLYPKEWRIKTTHIPNDYEAILRHT